VAGLELPEVELQTIVFDNAPGAQWLGPTAVQGEWLIREKWTWSSPNQAPQRRGFNVETGEWSDQVPWGAPNVANARRPLPHRIEAFASPDIQAREIVDLLVDVLREKLRAYKTKGAAQEKSDYELLLEQITAFQRAVVASAQEETEKIENAISELLEKVFPSHRIRLDAKPEADVEKCFTPFKAAPDLLMGPDNGYMSKVSQQGSGARRTLLWTALRYLSESGPDAGSRPHVLLLDEPEMCLHPNAIREAREVLYSLPATKNWQVMITTHSPVFIDLAKDNTTVIRVERDAQNAVHSVTLYRPLKEKLDDDDRSNLKALNACDPYVNEFFFGGRPVVVEGDTEYTAFQLMRQSSPNKYSDVQIIRARGKGSILTVLKILNQFSASYGVLHDADRPLTSTGAASAAWGCNASIRAAIEAAPAAQHIKHIVSVLNFETALFGAEATAEKPYNAHLRIKADPAVHVRAEAVLDSLLDAASPPGHPFVRWTSFADLEAAVAAA
jgi:putative ATP-dependent endonuclease of the OLD family